MGTRPTTWATASTTAATRPSAELGPIVAGSWRHLRASQLGEPVGDLARCADNVPEIAPEAPADGLQGAQQLVDR